jgi:ATP-dependent helicase HrpA
VIITSATIDAERFARHFGTPEKPAPVIEVSGRLYPVEVRYRPVEPATRTWPRRSRGRRQVRLESAGRARQARPDGRGRRCRR